MSPDIQELDARTVDRIAAGEVVERPASAVKELVENSIDADASRVEVAVEADGTERIEVRDDGVGMTEQEVRLAVREHTTSKIESIDDLEAGVATLGFRGEALHAVGAVSRTTVRTKPRGGGRGTELVVEGGEVTDVEPVGCPEGTTVVVEDLFYNVPARRKYLKTEATEFSHVNSVVTGYALANPDVAVALSHDGRETFATGGQGDLRSTVMAVYGREVASAMIPVEVGADGDWGGADGGDWGGADGGDRGGADGGDRGGADGGDDLPDGPLEGVSGLVSHPETTRASREYITTFVNGRYVRAGAVREAVVDAYGAQLAADRYPFAVLFLDLPGDTVDVNVHPRKREVRFADEDGVREQVRAAVREALLSEGLVRSSAPRGRSAPDETEVSPERTVRESDSLAGGTDADRWRDETADADLDLDPDAGLDAAVAERPAPPDEREAASDPDLDPDRWHAERTPTRGSADSASDPGTTADAPSDASTADDASSDPGTVGGASSDSAATDRDAHRKPHRKFRDAPSQATLGDAPDGAKTREFDRLPSMRVLGQVHDTYLVAETDDGLVLVDQHAADERVNYERLRERFAGDVTTQALADPVDLELTAGEADLFEAHRDALAQLGFRATRVDDRTVRVTTVPALLAETAGPDLVRDLLGEFVEGDPEGTVEAVADDLLADLACYPSITGNTSLREGSVVDLLGALDDCENPYACPHGRPVLIEFSEREIEDRFERDYPGHD